MEEIAPLPSFQSSVPSTTVDIVKKEPINDLKVPVLIPFDIFETKQFGKYSSTIQCRGEAS